jgi:hypothetical protein
LRHDSQHPTTNHYNTITLRVISPSQISSNNGTAIYIITITKHSDIISTATSNNNAATHNNNFAIPLQYVLIGVMGFFVLTNKDA